MEHSRTRKNNIGVHQRINVFMDWLADFKKKNPPQAKKQTVFVKNYK